MSKMHVKRIFFPYLKWGYFNLILAILCQDSLEVTSLDPKRCHARDHLLEHTFPAAKTRRDLILSLTFPFGHHTW